MRLKFINSNFIPLFIKLDLLNKPFSKFAVFLFLIFLSKWGQVFSQAATFSTIPAATSGSINICAGSTILFNSTVNPSSLFAPAVYTWNFGNGQTSAIPGPIGINYATPGSYTVTFNISSAGTALTQTSVPLNGYLEME